MVPAESTLTPAKPPSKPKLNAKPDDLPKLPIPKLEDTCKRYVRALEGLQDDEEHAKTKAVVEEFLKSGEGEFWQKQLEKYNQDKDSYIEEFWCKFDATLSTTRYG